VWYKIVSFEILLNHKFRGGAACLVVDNQKNRYPGFSFLTCSLMDKYLSSGVVDLDIRLVAHINSGSYRGEAETH
jgi:hypothetical protein